MHTCKMSCSPADPRSHRGSGDRDGGFLQHSGLHQPQKKVVASSPHSQYVNPRLQPRGRGFPGTFRQVPPPPGSHVLPPQVQPNDQRESRTMDQGSVPMQRSFLPASSSAAHVQPFPHQAPPPMTSPHQFPAVPPPVPPWFNPSRPVFPDRLPLPLATPPHLPGPAHPMAPPTAQSPLPFPHPFPPRPFLLLNLPPPPPHQQMQASFNSQGPPFRTPHQRTSSFDPKTGLPGFQPAPAPVGIKERMGLTEVKGQKREEASQTFFGDWIGQGASDASDIFISNWLKQVGGSYLMHQQHRSEVEQHTLKVSTVFMLKRRERFVCNVQMYLMYDMQKLE